jgi:CBS-domain-containing membrane protein
MKVGSDAAVPVASASRPSELADALSELLRRLDRQAPRLVDTANPEFLDAMVAVEEHVRELLARPRRRHREDTLADLIDRSPLSRAEKELLHDLRQVRNTLVHNTEVHVAKNFARTALQRLHQIAIRLDMGRLTAAAVMTREVRSVPPDAPLSEVQATLLRDSISQVAVISPDGRLEGWITPSRSATRAKSKCDRPSW